MSLFSHPDYSFLMIFIVTPGLFGLAWSLMVVYKMCTLKAESPVPSWACKHPIVFWKANSMHNVWMSNVLRPSFRDVPVVALVTLFTGPMLMFLGMLFLAAYIVALDFDRAERLKAQKHL